MIPDPNDEILAIKRRLAARFDNDLHKIAEDTRSRQNEGGREVVSFPPRRCEPRGTTNYNYEGLDGAVGVTAKPLKRVGGFSG